MRDIHVDQVVDERPRVVEEKVGDDGHERRRAQAARERRADAALAADRLEAAARLVGLETVHHMAPAGARGNSRHLREAAIEGEQTEAVLEERRRHANRGERARHDRADRRAVGPAARGERRVGHGQHRDGARLVELAHDERREVRERRLGPVDGREAVAGLPVAQPDEVEAGSVSAAAVLARGAAGQALQHQQLDPGQCVQVHERGGGRRVRHGIGTSAITSAMTASTVSPCAAACGPSQRRWPSTKGARAWMSSG